VLRTEEDSTLFALRQASGFARTGQAMRLMESLAVAIGQNEPVLLIGETGVGKTTLLQEVAQQVQTSPCPARFACFLYYALMRCVCWLSTPAFVSPTASCRALAPCIRSLLALPHRPMLRREHSAWANPKP
jgi:NACHT domain